MSQDTSSTPLPEALSHLDRGVPPLPCPNAVPELLAPAGDWNCARAAVENGADAIYFGLDRFNARMRAQNFSEVDLPKLLEFLHRRGVRGYVTLNTLVFQNELAAAESYLRAIITAGVDAVIVQDVGLCRLIRALSPDFPIHASTQMTVTSAAGVAFARALGCQLVVLARECSLKEIEQIQQSQTTTGPSPALPLEVFVHGALCVAYSGQCLTSEALGGRSANRGECAQACRMPYELIADGQKVPLGDRRYLLSPQDLAGLELVPELARLGMASLKIEGRLKSPEYVANITRIYRRALDHLCRQISPSALESSIASRSSPANRLSKTERYELEMAFSRGLDTGWFRGINNQKLVHARFGKKRGVYLGEVTRVGRDSVAVHLVDGLKAGDGIVFDAGDPENAEEGGRVYGLEKRGVDTVLTFGRGDLDFRRIHAGDKVWKTSDPELERHLRSSFTGDKPRFQRPVHLEVHGHEGGHLSVIARDDLGHVVRVESSLPLTKATAQPLTTERLRQFLGRLGGTSFFLGTLESQLEGPLILPFSELNRLRREWVADLEILRARPPRWQLRSSIPNDSQPSFLSDAAMRADSAAEHKPELIVLTRSREQLETVLACGIRTVYCEFEDPKKYRDAVHRFRQYQETATKGSSAIFVAPPRIFKMGEDWILKQVRSCEPDGFLVRNYDHLRWFEGCRCVGDYSLNVANIWTADYLKRHFNLERLTASYDLNAEQLEALVSAGPPDWFEVTIHQHMPMFHMEHCVFCAFLSKGTDYTNCGRPCDKHDLQLHDRVGAKHPVKADAGCRNTVFNALAQTGAESVSKLRHLGVRHFRIEFLNEPPALVQRTITQYQAVLTGQITGASLWRELRLLNRLGVTRGDSQSKG